MASTTRRTTRNNDRLEQESATIRQGLHDISSAAKELATHSVEAVRGTAHDYMDQGRTRVQEASESLGERVRDKPMKSLLLAAAAGFVIGLLWRRR